MTARVHALRRLLAVCLCASFATWNCAQAGELRVATSGGFTAALEALAPAYERASGDHLIVIRGPSMGQTPQSIPNRLQRGEAIDVVIVAASALDDLVRDGAADASTRAVLARSLIAAARFAEKYGFELRPGDVVMAGGATAAAAVEGGAQITLETQHLAPVSFSFSK